MTILPFFNSLLQSYDGLKIELLINQDVLDSPPEQNRDMQYEYRAQVVWFLQMLLKEKSQMRSKNEEEISMMSQTAK